MYQIAALQRTISRVGLWVSLFRLTSGRSRSLLRSYIQNHPLLAQFDGVVYRRGKSATPPLPPQTPPAGPARARGCASQAQTRPRERD
jgi:hypothetical protein